MSWNIICAGSIDGSKWELEYPRVIRARDKLFGVTLKFEKGNQFPIRSVCKITIVKKKLKVVLLTLLT